MSKGSLNHVMGIVLAGGKSTRMGRDKASVVVGSSSMLRVTTNSLESADLGSIAIVGLTKNNDINTKALFLDDIYRDSGPLSGVHSAIKHALSVNKTGKGGSEVKGLLIVPVDMPGLSSQLLSVLAERGLTHNSFTCFKRNNKIVYLPLYVPVSEAIGITLDALMCPLGKNGVSRVDNTQTSKIRALSIRHFLKGQDVEFVETDDKNAFININTPDELSRFNAVNR